MRFARALSICVLSSGLLLAGSPDQNMNVNTRYTVESVELAGSAQVDISTGLRSDLKHLVGEKLNPALLDSLALRLRRELHVRAVTHRLVRGQTPQHVRVVFEVRGRPAKFELSAPKILYSSFGGFTGAAEATGVLGSQAFTAGVLSDGDDLLERYTGVLARYELRHLAGGRAGVRLDFESYHDQWDPATVTAASAPGAPAIYRARQNIEPLATFALTHAAAAALDLTLGASFETLQPQLPAAPAESANAMVATLRFHRRLETSGANQQEWDAGYSLRAATGFLGSDFAYTRHQGDAQYVYLWGRNQVLDNLTVGFIAGRAPLFERFMLGNSTLLRGWNRFELDPLGGSRMICNSLEYRYGLFDVFYDTGAIWDQGQTAVFRHALGVGIRQNGLYAALAFPVKEGHIEPVFMVGMNY